MHAGDEVEAGGTHAAREEDLAVHSTGIPRLSRLLVQGIVRVAL